MPKPSSDHTTKPKPVPMPSGSVMAEEREYNRRIQAFRQRTGRCILVLPYRVVVRRNGVVQSETKEVIEIEDIA